MENVDKNTIVDSDDGHVEVDAVIDEQDAVMHLIIEASNEATAREQFQLLLAQAQGQSPAVTGSANWVGKQLEGQLRFPSAAERLTFEMGLG
ncbi:DUF406 family protein [Ferrimonas balearica]|uniref:DUF406 family protein n=1 Tax=Ferrimonas balearica TaxID=44012 RepID=UPI001C99C10C|nr:DUF406 family protein [Ferrimonas balearica]MBY5920567.1 DUF406 family protein [Ferrimonas balearica]MBY5996748.1 DUF406 family protein [Ferrimonas balearica]